MSGLRILVFAVISAFANQVAVICGKPLTVEINDNLSFANSIHSLVQGGQDAPTQDDEQQSSATMAQPTTTSSTLPEESMYTKLEKINELIEQKRKYERVFLRNHHEKEITDESDDVKKLRILVRDQLLSRRERTRKAKELADDIQRLLIERTYILMRIAEEVQQQKQSVSSSTVAPNELGLKANDNASANSKRNARMDALPSEGEQQHQQQLPKGYAASKLICQFFVFGTIFGVVCSISACTCLFRSRIDGLSSVENGSLSSLSRLAETPEPFDSTKPYCLKVDEKGLCYASPLPRGEIPPLPSYSEALQMPTNALAHLFPSKTQEKPAE